MLKTEAYRKWLAAQGYDHKTVEAQLYRTDRVEKHYGDLDEHYTTDKISGLVESMRYSKSDERRKSPNPCKIPFNGNVYNNTTAYRNAMIWYIKFIEETNANINQETRDEERTRLYIKKNIKVREKLLEFNTQVNAAASTQDANRCLLDAMSIMIHKLGLIWAGSDGCPRVAVEVVKSWNNLLNEWLSDDSLPLLVRKSSLVRGSEIKHKCGRMIIPTDNSPAQWACSLSLQGRIPTITDIHNGFDKDEIPVSFAHIRNEFDKRKYHCTLGAHSINKDRWKLCHITPVGQKSRTPLETIDIEILKRSFFDLLSPENYFLLPIKWGGLGETQEFIDGFLEYGQQTNVL